MGLSEIAAGIEVTAEQEKRGVATVDDTDATLEERLAAFADTLPCRPAEAAAAVEQYAAGGSVGAAAAAAGVPAVTAAKTLHLLGESVSPVGSVGRDVVRDWVAGELSRSEAEELARVSGAEFALAAYVETHEPLEGARAAVEGVLMREGRGGIGGPDGADGAVGDAPDLR
jgi:hypothetical protein